MTEVELAKLMRKSNYTCQGIDCKECIIVNRYKTCLMEDVQIYCDDILGADDNYLETLEKENAELKEFAEKLSEQHADEWQKQQEVITELKEQIEKMKKYCGCEYCINVVSGDEFIVENTNKTVCEYCVENNKKFWKSAE